MEAGTDESCRIAVKTIIHYHDQMKDQNGKVCMMGKYHNILYVAMKLCYDWQLKDMATVSNFIKFINSVNFLRISPLYLTFK